MAANLNGLVADPSTDVKEHPLVRDVNEEHQEKLSPVEKFCKSIADATGAPLALFLAIVAQIGWVILGSLYHWDPYPFVFLLTISNIIQLILIFVIAVAQRQSSAHAELRAEIDHENISLLLHHQELQEEVLIRLATHSGCDIADIEAAFAQLTKAA